LLFVNDYNKKNEAAVAIGIPSIQFTLELGYQGFTE
jgi:hypothetical protein